VLLRRAEQYDAIVVGSGVSGGWAAKELCEKGLKTLILERGRDFDPAKDYFNEHKPSWQFPLRERKLTPAQAPDHPVQAATPSYAEPTKHLYIKDRENPYEEAQPFLWVQGDQVGGRSLMWGRQTYRWSDLDFEANLKDGHGIDWPVRYADIAPWYSYVEKFAGVSGQRENMPQAPDSEFQPPMAMNAAEKFVKAGIERAYPSRRMTIGRCAVLTAPLGDRKPCHFCGPCIRGCSTNSFFSSHSSTLPAARKTGKLTIRPRSLAHSVIYDPKTRRASGVRYVDTETGDMHDVSARVVFLCASSLASTRILLNSRSPEHPNGLGAESGALGRCIMDHHLRVGARGDVPGLLDRYYEGNRPNGIYLIRFRNLAGPTSDNLGFARGYAYQGGAGRADWTRGADQPEVGVALKRALRDPGPWSMGLGGFGECLPREENYVELSDKKDPWGIPVLRFHVTWGDNERAMRKDIAAQAAEMLEAAGCKNVETHDNLEGRTANPGGSIHEMGGARMGRDRKTSVLNAYNQVWDAPNVFVTDGAFMNSTACVNPSLTYMAFTARAADHAVTLLKRREL
jgi:choline dehydrogenase-like flavoprotein